jgi:zinc protease
MSSLTAMIYSSMLLAAAGASAAESSAVPKIAFEKYTLPNGLDVILNEDHSTPIVCVNVWYHAGSKNEVAGRTGFAHLFEHMMFQGSKHYDKNYFGPIQKAGGKLNGSTSQDRTNYWELVPSNYLELALWMESDRMGFLLPAMTQPKLDNQRDVVKNERRQSYENRPYGLVFETILAAMYPTEHPYSWPTIGAMTDLNKASRQDIAAFFRRYYHPSNASLCIVGDFKPDDAKRMVAKYFGTLPGGPKVQRMKPRPVELKEEKRVKMTDRVGLSRLCIAWPSVPDYADDDAELSVLGHVLGGGKTSRLYRTLVRDKQIALDVQAMQNGSEIAGMFMVMLTARPGHSLAELETAALKEIGRIQAEPPTAEEVAQAVNSFESHLVRSMESIGESGGRADQLNMYNVMTGDPGYVTKEFEKLRAVDPAAVTRVAKKYLGTGRVVLEVTPGKKLSIAPDVLAEGAAAREKAASQLHDTAAPVPIAAEEAGDFDRSVMPQPAGEPKFQLPPVHRGRLSNGMEVLLVEKHELPMVNIHVVFPVGRFNDPADKPGLASMMTAVWDEGTTRRSSEQIASELAGIGASLSLDSGSDATSARLFTLKSHLGKALDIYADVLRNPSFPQGELDRQKASALGHLNQVRNEPVLLASVAVNQLLYGIDHPYGRPPFASAKTLASLTRDEIEQFYRHHIRPQDSGVIAVGDITMEELTTALEKVLGGWKSVSAEGGDLSPAMAHLKPTSLILVDKPGAAQSVISIALPGDVRTSPDYFRMLMMNAIFGGQFSSRLNLNLREKKGYTYGARSAFEWRVHGIGPFVASASVQTGVTTPALAEFLKEMDGMVGGRPVTQPELDFCRKYFVRGYPGMFETTGQVAGQLETLWTYGLPNDFFNTVVPKISAVNADDVLRMAKKYLKLQNLLIVVVGDRAKIEADLRELPVGKDLTVYEFDDDFHLTPAK